jgi:ferredoxin
MLRLFYFSGTGNARNAAHWIASVWREHGREAEALDIARLRPEDVRIEADDEVGIASPTHGFNFPPLTLSFLFGLPRAPRANRAFVVNTRGDLRLFGLCVPGLSGIAQVLAALVLLAKGYRIAGMRPIDLPSNWISLHPGLSEENVRIIYERCHGIARRFAERLLGGGRDLRALWDLPQDLLVSPIALGYFCIGRFFLAKSFVASQACDGCGACVTQCPTGALRLVDGRPFWTWRCESCMRCINLCPRRAIETAHGFVLGFSLLLSLLASALIAPQLGRFVPGAHAALLQRLARAVVDNALGLALLFLAYGVLHRALRLRLVDRLVVWTSLTHLRLWRRYRAPRPG